MAELKGRHFKNSGGSVQPNAGAAPRPVHPERAAHRAASGSDAAPASASVKKALRREGAPTRDDIAVLHRDTAAQGTRFKKPESSDDARPKFGRSRTQEAVGTGSRHADAAKRSGIGSHVRGADAVKGTQSINNRAQGPAHAHNTAHAQGAVQANNPRNAAHAASTGGIKPLRRIGAAGEAKQRAVGKPNGKKAKRDVISTVMICIGLVLLLVAGGLFVYAQMGYKRASDYYGSIADDVLEDTGGVPKIDFAALKKISNDVVGWIYIPDTKVNYVVAKGDTNEKYLRHMLNGEYNQNGTVFMDSADTAPGMVDQQTTIYGHHMEDGSMFQFIDQTQDQKVFDTVKEVYYITDGKTYVLRPLFTMVVEDNYLNARVPNFEDMDEFHQYLSNSLKHARAQAKDASERIKDVDRVMTLITCAGDVIPRTTRAGMVCEVVDSFEN